ncbi:hypothetical protein B5X24_HaOG215162 [Helicoverpa armigera]|nr:hypothetical protein B5X24_HaOG215162 [Helicoverpa armigera]
MKGIYFIMFVSLALIVAFCSIQAQPIDDNALFEQREKPVNVRIKRLVCVLCDKALKHWCPSNQIYFFNQCLPCELYKLIMDKDCPVSNMNKK